MEVLYAFILGALFGSSAVFSYGLYQIHKIKRVKENLLGQIKAKATEMEQKKDSIKDRLIKASEIAQTQMALRAQLEMPSKNALHSRYKNGLGGELQELEQKKLDLLRTVLAEGFDPTITVINEAGAKTEVPLSSYVNDAAVALNTSLGNPPSVDPNLPKRTSKFVLYKGGKDDGTTH